jgi:hypothetical protein
VLENRAEGDHDLEFEPGEDQAAQDVERAGRFLTRVERALLEMGILQGIPLSFKASSVDTRSRLQEPTQHPVSCSA